MKSTPAEPRATRPDLEELAVPHELGVDGPSGDSGRIQRPLRQPDARIWPPPCRVQKLPGEALSRSARDAPLAVDDIEETLAHHPQRRQIAPGGSKRSEARP